MEDIIYSRYEQTEKRTALRNYIGGQRAKYHYIKEVKNCKKQFQRDDYSMPETIEVETVNRCNNDCSFCPVNRKEEQRELHRMSDALLDKILTDLSDMGYNGMFQLFSNNEPLLDAKIYDRLVFARKKLPNAFMILLSNGILLKEEHYKDILDNVDMFVIDNYDDELKLLPAVEKMYHWVMDDNRQYMDRIEIHMRKKHEILTSRGGYLLMQS